MAPRSELVQPHTTEHPMMSNILSDEHILSEIGFRPRNE